MPRPPATRATALRRGRRGEDTTAGGTDSSVDSGAIGDSSTNDLISLPDQVVADTEALSKEIGVIQ